MKTTNSVVHTPVVHTLGAIALLVALAPACGKKDQGEKQEPTGSATGTAAAFTGPLTEATVMTAADVVKPFDNWTKGFASLKSKLGAPTLIEGTSHYWAVTSGESCSYVYVTKDNEADFFKDKKDPQEMIGTVSQPMAVTKSSANWDECMKATGVAPAAEAIDPNAPLPPEQGLVSVETFRAGISGAKSKWVNQSISIEGSYAGTSTSSATGSEEKSVILTIRGEGKETVSCSLISGATPPTLTQGDAIKVTGKATGTFGGGLKDCALLGGE